MNTQELIERLTNLVESDDHERLNCDARYAACSCGYEARKDAALIEAAQALTASQERERVLREALEAELVAPRAEPLDAWHAVHHVSAMLKDVERHQALQSTEQHG